MPAAASPSAKKAMRRVPMPALGPWIVEGMEQLALFASPDDTDADQSTEDMTHEDL